MDCNRTDPHTCPHCGADMKDGKYSRVIGVEWPHIYDGVLYWMCPDCDGTWHRWSDGHRLNKRATEMMDSAHAAFDPS